MTKCGKTATPSATGRSRGTAFPLQTKESEWMTIKLRDYLRLHPNQGVELLTEFGYYTLTKQEIKTQLRKHGAVRSVTGRPLSFDTLLEQEVLDEQPGDPPLLRTGRKERRDEPC